MCFLEGKDVYIVYQKDISFSVAVVTPTVLQKDKSTSSEIIPSAWETLSALRWELHNKNADVLQSS